MTRHLVVDRDRPEDAAIQEAARLIRAGGLVAFPTETVYGLGADATNPDAVARIFEAKGRPATNPLIVHGRDVGMIRPAVSAWPLAASRLAQRFWPGPLTLILPRSDLIPDAVTAAQGTVGVRVPDSEVARWLLLRADRPIAAPSANRSTGVSPTTAGHVLKDLDGRIDLVLDAGRTPIGIESTVLDLTTDPPRVLRPGAITASQIGAVLGLGVSSTSTTSKADSAMTSPGQMEIHYAPRAHVQLVDPGAAVAYPWPWGLRYGLIVAGHELPAGLGAPSVRVDWNDPAAAARDLFETLHRWDDEGVPLIYVILPPSDDDRWSAVRDRLWRASRRWAREGQGRRPV